MDSLLIEGCWQGSDKTMTVINPWSGETIAEIACASESHVERALLTAVSGQQQMACLASHQKSKILKKAAELIRLDQQSFVTTLVSDSGKTLAAARKEVARCINTLELSADEAIRLVGETINFDSFEGGENRKGYFTYEPLGTVVAITPFNDPLNLVAHKLGPAIAVGNAVILKPAEQAPLCAIMLVKVLLEAGLPRQAVSVLTGYGIDFGEALVSDSRVAMVSFTGGEVVGGNISAQAGLKKLAMELGANSPVIVTANCALDKAVSECISGAYWAAGQNCIGVQRIFIEDSIYQDFRRLFVDSTAQLVTGNPMDDAVDVGPMINEAAAELVDQRVGESVRLGARLLIGGYRRGALYMPTVLDQVPAGAPVLETEIFGPVVSLISYDSLDAAIDEANRPDYMIHAAVYTNDLQVAFDVSRRLQCGGVLINDSTDYRLDAMPFGGAKRGSLGREGVKFTVREMAQTKTVCFSLDRVS